jgi:TatA/E family protein of Tat protein translocase
MRAMHVGDTIFIFCLALIIFGPKKLPEIGRQIGKLMVEFRRASNEFKMQIEEELRASEEAERQKEITAAKTMLRRRRQPAEVLCRSRRSQRWSVPATPVIAPPSTGLPVNHTFRRPTADGFHDGSSLPRRWMPIPIRAAASTRA